MKRMTGKINTSKKIIAMLLVLLLVVTPLASYLGRGSKAEGNEVQNIDISGEVLSVTLKKEVRAVEEGAAEEETGDEEGTGGEETVTPGEEVIYSAAADAVAEKKIVIPDFASDGQLFGCTIPTEVSVALGETGLEETSVTGKSVRAVIAPDAETDPFELGEPDPEFTLAGGEVIYLLATVELAESEEAFDVVVGKYAVAKESVALSGELSWTDGEGSGIADKVNSTDVSWFTTNTLSLTGVSLPETENVIYAAKIYYGQGLNPSNAKAVSETAAFSGIKQFRNIYGYADVAVGDTVSGKPIVTAVPARIDMNAPVISIELASGAAGTFADNILYDSPDATDSFKVTVTDDSALKCNVTFEGESLVSGSASDEGKTYTYTKSVKVGAEERTITISASDKASNRAQDVVIKVIPVDKELKFTVLPAYDGLSVNEDGQTNKRPSVTFAASSGSSLSSYVIKNGEDVLIDGAFTDVRQLTNGNYVSEIAKLKVPDTSVINLSFTGLTITVTDASGNEISSTLPDVFTFDATKPVMDGPKLQKKLKDGAWTTVGASEAQGATVKINPELGIAYRYAAFVSDAGANIKSVEAYFGDEAVELVEGEDGSYSYELTEDKLSNEPKAFSMMVTDKAGNSTGKTPTEAELKVKLADTALKLKLAAVYSDADCTKKISLKTASEYTYKNKSIYVKIEASSGRVVNDVTITAESGNATATKFDKELVVLSDEIEKRYTYSQVFELPPKVKNNGFENLTVTVSDAKQTVTDTLGNLFYDATKPKLEYKIPSGWTNDPVVEFTITSGSAAQESELVSGSYYTYGAVEDAEDTLKPVNGIITGKLTGSKVPQSISKDGTQFIFTAKDKAGNVLDSNNTFTVYYDSSRPVIDAVTINGESITVPRKPLNTSVNVNVSMYDNLTLGRLVAKVTGPDGKEYVTYDGKLDTLETIAEKSFTVKKADGDPELKDGNYKIKLTVYDLAGNVSDTITGKFTVDKTAPKVTGKIAGGTNGGFSPMTNFDGSARDYYYSSVVNMQFTHADRNMSSVTVTDNGIVKEVSWQSVGKYINSGTCDISGEGLHTVVISAVDAAGNKAEEMTVEFVIDTTAPTVAVLMNSLNPYQESAGKLMMTQNTSVLARSVDANVNKLVYRLSTQYPGAGAGVSDYSDAPAENLFAYSDEADYILYVYAVDMAGNAGTERAVSFRIDKAAPVLSIGGAGASGAIAEPGTVSFTMEESFFADAEGTVNIYRTPGDGVGESLYKSLSVKPASRVTTLSETLSETGKYRMEFTAKDAAGHDAQTSASLIVDTDAPVISIENINNYDKTKEDVQLSISVSDSFNSSKSVDIKGTRTDINGEKTGLTFEGVAVGSAPTVIEKLFTEDGIYDISVISTDAAGNKTEQAIHFTLDKTKPIIEGIEKYDGQKFKEFIFDMDLDELVLDLTVCDTHMYLNGSEYDGSAKVEDGSYKLVIDSTDELGHENEAEISFELDTKGPVFIVTGVEKDEVRNSEYNIGVSLQLDEDTLDEVTLNGQPIEIDNGAVNMRVVDKGAYTLSMKAHDEAGNASEETYNFFYGSETEKEHADAAKSGFPWWILIAVAVGAAAGVIIFIVTKKRKEE